jgi:hypothetical protein
MKKLYFLNEEESDRILNLHKDATKKQYISETLSLTAAQIAAAEAKKTSGNTAPIDYTSSDYFNTKFTPINTKFTPISGKTDTTLPPNKSTGYVNKPLVTKIQQSLKEKGINLGTSGPNKDGIDGVLGKLTLNGIITALGGGTTVAGTTTTETQPEIMSKKEVTTVQEPNATPELKTSTPSSGIASNDTAENSIDPV